MHYCTLVGFKCFVSLKIFPSTSNMFLLVAVVDTKTEPFFFVSRAESVNNN